MPLYDFTCERQHKTTRRADFDTTSVTCREEVVLDGRMSTVSMCGLPAKRDEIQQIAGVIFSGPGFTRTGA